GFARDHLQRNSKLGLEYEQAPVCLPLVYEDILVPHDAPAFPHRLLLRPRIAHVVDESLARRETRPHSAARPVLVHPGEDMCWRTPRGSLSTLSCSANKCHEKAAGVWIVLHSGMRPATDNVSDAGEHVCKGRYRIGLGVRVEGLDNPSRQPV